MVADLLRVFKLGRKVASAARCPFQAEIEFYFDKNKRFKDSSVENGELVSEEAWAAQRGDNY